MLAAEHIVKDLASRYANSYMLAIFSSCRQPFDEIKMSEMYSTQETELREGTLVGLGDIGIIMDELDEDEVVLPWEEGKHSTLKLSE